VNDHHELGPHPSDMNFSDRFEYWYANIPQSEFFVIVHATTEAITACGGAFPNMIAFGDLTIGLSAKLSEQSYALQRAGIQYEVAHKAGARYAVEQEEARG
jgi:hypothetical protein